MKELYRSLCREEPSIPLYSRDWWLDAVCIEGEWNVAVVMKNGKIEAAMPYFSPRPGTISMPQLTQTMGPWLRHQEMKYPKGLSRQKKLMDELISQLPDVKVFRQNFHCTIENWLPFYWQGFKQTTRYTYIIEDITNTDKVWKNTTTTHKRKIKTALRNNIEIVSGSNLDEFFRLSDLTFSRQHIPNPIKRAVVRSVYQAASSRDACDLLFARDSNGSLQATAFIVFTSRSAYYLMGGADPEKRSSGSQYLLLWEAIKRLSSKTKAFDFEGSMIENIEKTFRQFGARQTPYFTIRKDNRTYFEKSIDLAKAKIRTRLPRRGV